MHLRSYKHAATAYRKQLGGFEELLLLKCCQSVLDLSTRFLMFSFPFVSIWNGLLGFVVLCAANRVHWARDCAVFLHVHQRRWCWRRRQRLKKQRLKNESLSFHTYWSIWIVGENCAAQRELPRRSPHAATQSIFNAYSSLFSPVTVVWILNLSVLCLF